MDKAFELEKQQIRQKMLKFSKGINEGKSVSELIENDESSDDIIKKRLENSVKSPFESKAEKNYLKEDLINVKLEEKKSLSAKWLSKFKKTKPKSEKKDTKTKSQTPAENAPKPPKISDIQARMNTANPARQSMINRQKMLEESIPKPTPKPRSKINFRSTYLKPELLKEANAKKAEFSPKIQPKIQKNEPNLKDLSAKTSQKPPKPSKPSLSDIATNFILQSQNADENSSQIKSVLLEGHKHATKDEKNLGKNQLLFAALCIAFAVLVFVPKIYITSNIYYLSRDIASLRTQEGVLSEENKELNKKLENMRFQNQILDYLE